MTNFSLTQCVENQPLSLATALIHRQLTYFRVLSLLAMAILNVQLFYQYHYAACAVQKGTLALAVGRVAKIDLVTIFDCDFQLYWTSDYVINN